MGVTIFGLGWDTDNIGNDNFSRLRSFWFQEAL